MIDGWTIEGWVIRPVFGECHYCAPRFGKKNGRMEAWKHGQRKLV